MAVELLENSVLKKEVRIKQKIEEELKKLHYNFSYKGTEYLIEVIYILYSLNFGCDCNLEKEIYPIVAQKYNQSVNSIKCNITNSTDKMCYDCCEKVLVSYLGDYKFSKPGPKRIIFAILKKVYMN